MLSKILKVPRQEVVELGFQFSWYSARAQAYDLCYKDSFIKCPCRKQPKL